VVEIRNGKPVGRIVELWLSVASRSLLNAQLVALGDARTAWTGLVLTDKSMPWQSLAQPVTAPAAQAKDLDVVLPYRLR